jgi:5'-3' exonuclease
VKLRVVASPRLAAPLLLVDAPYMLYRAFFALPEKITGLEDRPVNALLGSVNAILSVVEEEQPRATLCCMGPDAAPYRTELYPPYHAHRPPMPDALAWQWERAPALYEALGWPAPYDASLEADDLLGAHARLEASEGGSALILTGDRDLFQCATGDVTILLLGGRGKKGPERVDPADVRRRYGIDPAQVPDFIALRGDPSDGLPGAKGIGEKRAAEILRRAGSLEEALAEAEADGAAPSSLLAVADELRAFREIATLREVDVQRPPDAPTDYAGGAAAARELGMDRLAERLEKEAAAG